MRQLTKEESLFFFFKISKLPIRQLTVVFCAESLIFLKLAVGYSYLTKISGICQKA